MSHLTLEAIARLVDEPPAPAEASHLSACETCRTELEAMREDRQALAALPRLAPAPDAWPALRSRLRKEGLVSGGGRWRPGRPGRPAVRAAAASLLFLTGSAVGWAARGPAAGGAGAPGLDLADGGASSPGVERVADAAMTEPGGPTDPAGSGDGAADAFLGGMEPAGPEETFMAALDVYMTSSEHAGPADPAARLAALDNIVLTTAEALNEAPSDPLLNSYYRMAQAQRRVVLQQIQATAGEPVF